jgi:hypothetical protein
MPGEGENSEEITKFSRIMFQCAQDQPETLESFTYIIAKT